MRDDLAESRRTIATLAQATSAQAQRYRDLGEELSSERQAQTAELLQAIWAQDQNHRALVEELKREHRAEMTALQRRSPRLNVLVVSSGGVRNYGDDAILISSLQRLRRVRPNCLATVISDGPDCPPLGRLGVWGGTCREFCAGLNPDDVRRALRNADVVAEDLAESLAIGSATRVDLNSFDVVLISGGGYLNYYWPDLTAWRVAIAAAASAVEVPYVLSGQGVGPVSPQITPMISFLIGAASAVATRDQISLQLLKQIVPNGPPIEMVGDDALGLGCDEPALARRRLAKLGVPIDRPLLGFQARASSYVGFTRDELRETAQHVDNFAADNGFEVVAVPINMQSEGPEVELVTDLAKGKGRRAAWHVVDHASDIAATAGVIKVCSALITHTYHAAIFALENGIPTLLVARTKYYRQKGEALRTSFGIPVPIIARSNLSADAIAEGFASMAQAPWSKAMTSPDVDAWLNTALPPQQAGAQGESILRISRGELGIAG
jgi:polysaccharide pyruvyl transferase WcaK-like protein